MAAWLSLTAKSPVLLFFAMRAETPKHQRALPRAAASRSQDDWSLGARPLSQGACLRRLTAEASISAARNQQRHGKPDAVASSLYPMPKSQLQEQSQFCDKT
ncbi:hypothetical protein [Bosea sp. CRIB-10]|uniref:hypothetical protein n=1 Tax=Bosea sp. CRIB-10 TaxID=378404 RepID=UPI0011136F0E|nr:hypothetical protein [Bosea sp. CRIB-10]